MYTIIVSKELKEACPVFAGVAIYAEVKNTSYCEGLWEEIQSFTEMLTATTRLEDIKKQPVIAATREAYKRCGKDPGRYRPSAEALRRRLMRGIALYQIDTLVDLINLVSLRTGHSIGGFDADKIAGTGLELGIGKINEPFEGIGRGVLNIEGLPVYRDAVGVRASARKCVTSLCKCDSTFPVPHILSLKRRASMPAISKCILIFTDVKMDVYRRAEPSSHPT